MLQEKQKKSTGSFNQELVEVLSDKSSEKQNLKNDDLNSNNNDMNKSPLIKNTPILSDFKGDNVSAFVQDIMSEHRYTSNKIQLKQKLDAIVTEQDKFVNVLEEESSVASHQNLRDLPTQSVSKSKFQKQKSKLSFLQKDSKIKKAVKKWRKKNINILFKRKLFRILLLIGVESVIIALFIAFFNNLGYNRGNIQLNASDSVDIEINQCVIKMIDVGKKDESDLNYLARMSIPQSIDGDILMTYSFPDETAISQDYSVDSSKANSKSFYFKNSANFKSCEIAFYVYKVTTLNSLSINCLDKDCQIFIDSSNLKFTKLNIQGPKLYLNSPNLEVDTLHFYTFQGNFEASNFKFTNANIETTEGDISIQSLKSISATVELANKYYCVTTYSATSITDTIINNPNSCTSVFAFGDIEKDPKNKIAQRCYKGTIVVPSDIGGAQQLIARNTYGNLFINVLKVVGQAADQVNANIVYDQTIYGANGDSINFSSSSQDELNNQLKTASSPNIYDPIFILRFGSQIIQSNTFSQWQITYNPAYSYFKPWWLGTLTLGLMNSQRFENQYVLAPGFCPYVNSLSQKRLNVVNNLLKTHFELQKNSDNFIQTLAWQQSIDIPPFKFLPASTYSGIRDISLTDNYEDNWLKLNKNNDGTISITYLTLSQNRVLEAAVIVSFILAFIVGLVLIVGIVYVVNVNYIYLLDHISNTDTYSKIQKKQQDSNIRAVEIEEELEEEEEDKKNEQGQLGNIKQRDVIQIQYSVKGLLRLFYNLIYLSPPLSAYIDQIVLLFQKARTNSIREFYKLLFKEVQINEKASDDIIHNLEKDSILGSEMKGLYEQYCYLNKLLERKLDEEDGINQAQKRGFKIVKKYDALIQSYSYIKYNGKIVSISDTQNKGSLELFIESCCTLTKFESDSIDSITFDQYYNDFCLMNHIMKQPISEGQLQRDFGIETKYDPQQVIERDPNYDLQTQKKMYIIDKKRVQNTFKLLLSKDLQDKVFKTEEMEEVKKEIYAPNFWWFYDTLTVLAHLGSVLILGCPVVILVIFIRIQQSNYSSVPIQRQLFKYDIIEQPSSIPYKLMADDNTIQAITVITGIFLALSSWDLIYYYIQMYIPQERYFQNYQKSGPLRKLTSKVMWVIVMLIIYFVTIYLSLVGTWLILSAIINPEAFLPYATSAATFVTLVTKKYQQFKDLSENGIKMLTDYLKGMAEKQFKDILKKMDIGGKIESVLPTEQIKGLCAEAAALGLIDPKLSENIQDNVNIMVRDPDAVAHLGKDMLSIAQDPRQYAVNIMNQLEEKAKQQLEQQIKQYLPLMSKNLTQFIFSILTNQKSRLKTELSTVLSDLCLEIQSKNKDKIDPKMMKQLEILQGPVLRLLFECIQSQDNQSRQEQVDNIIQQFSVLVASFVMAKFPFDQQKFNQVVKAKENAQEKVQASSKSTGYDFKSLLNSELKKIVKTDDIITEKVVEKAIKSIFQGIYRIFIEFEKKNVETLLKEFIKLIQEFQSVPVYKNIKEISQFTELLSLIVEISVNLKSLSRTDILRMLKNFIQDSKIEDKFDICQFNIIDFLDFIILIIGGYNQEQKTPEVNQIKDLFISIFKESPEAQKMDIKQLSSLIAFVVLGFRSNLQNIPTDVIKDVLEWLLKQYSKQSQHLRLEQFLQLVLDSQGGNKGNSSQQKLTIIQDFLSLLEKLFNNVSGQIENLQINSQRVYGIQKDFSTFFLNIIKCKNKNIMSYSDWQVLLSNKYFQIVAKKMKMSSDDLHGLIFFILNQVNTPQCQSFIRMIFDQYKINQKYIKIFIHLMNFVSSSDDASLHQALYEFDFEKNIKFKFLESANNSSNNNNNNKKEKKMEYNDFKFILQFLRGKYEYKYFEQQISSILLKYFPDFKSTIANNANAKNQSTNVINFIKNIEFSNEALSYMIKNINNGFITQAQIVQLVKHLKIKDGKLDSNIVNLFGKIISLKNLSSSQLTSSSTIFKEQVQNLSSIINLDEKIVQTFLQLILCPDDKLFEQIQLDFLKNFNQSFYLKTKYSSLSDAFQIPINGLNYSQYISHCVQNIKEMDDYQVQVQKINKNMFQNKVPLDLLKSIAVDMKIPKTTETIYFLLQLTNKKIPKSLNKLIKFVFNSLSNLEKEKFVYEILKNNSTNDGNNILGLNGLVDIFTNTNSFINLQIFLQYLADSNKEYILLIACMFCYLDGKSDNIIIKVKDSSVESGSSKITVEQYLAKQLDIKIEFFQALPAIFSSNLQQFSSALIKLFRQIDYQEQRFMKQIKSQGTKNNQIQPIDALDIHPDIIQEIIEKKFKNQTSGIKLDNQQENFVNNVTIQDKEVEQYIKLVQGQPINTSFFSRELQISLDVVEFLQFINAIKIAKDSKSINQVFEEMKNHSSVIQVLRAININLNDLKNCIKLMYKNFEIQEASQLQFALNLPSSVPIEVLQDLLLLDQDINDYSNLEKSRKILTNSLNQNQLHQSLGIKTYWSSLAYCLTQDYILLEAFFEKNTLLQLATSNNVQLRILFQGIIGIIQKKKTVLLPEKIYKDIYSLMEKENKQKNEDGEVINQEENENSQEDNEETSENQDNRIKIEKSNTFEYALYLMYKVAGLSPVWTLLMSGDINSWDYYILRYYYTYKYKNTPQLNPVMSLMVILQLLQTPTIFKEILSYFEFYLQVYRNSEQTGESEGDTDKVEIENSKKFLQLQGDYLQKLISKDANKVTELAQLCQFPKYILQIIAQEEYNSLPQNEKKDYSPTEINKLFERAVKLNNQGLMEKNTNFREFLCQLYTDVDKNCFKQPKETKRFTFQAQFASSLHQNPIIHLLLISSLTQLQDSYNFIFQCNDRGLDHLRQVSYVIDFVLTTVDIFYFFKIDDPSFQKFYMFPILGMACGFNLDGNEIKSSSPISCIMNKQLRSEYLKLKTNEEILHFKMNCFQDVFHDIVKTIKIFINKNQEVEKDDKQIVKRYSFDLVNCINHAVRSEKGKSYMNRLSDEYDCFIHSQYFDQTSREFFKLNSLNPKEQSDQLGSITDSEVLEQEKSYLEFSDSPNTVTILGFFKLDYECLNNNTLLNQKYQQDLKLFVSILQMYGSLCSSFTKTIDSEMFNGFMSQSTQYMSSNKKAIFQILSLFFESIESDLSTISDAMNTNTKMLKSFATVFLNHSKYDHQDMNQLLSLTNYTEVNKEVIKKIILIYNGYLDALMELPKFSPQFQYTQSYEILYQFLYSFDSYSISSQNKDPKQINISSLIFLSPDQTENKQMIQKIIFRLCKEVIRQQVQVAQTKNINKEFVEKYADLSDKEKDDKDSDKFMISAIDSITENNWKFLFSKDETLINLVMNQVFNLSDKQIKLFKIFSIFKPYLLRFPQKEINKMIHGDTIKKGFDTLVEFGLLDKGIRREYFDLILGITNQRGFLALDALIALQDAQKVFGINQSLQNDQNGEGMKEKQQESQVNENIHCALILRSIYLWKKISASDFDFDKCPLEIKQQIADSLTFITAHIVDMLQSKTNNNHSTAHSLDSSIFTFKNLTEKFNAFIKSGTPDYSYLDDLEVMANSDKSSLVNVFNSFNKIQSKIQPSDLSNYLTIFFQSQIYQLIVDTHPSLKFIDNILSCFLSEDGAISDKLLAIFTSEDPNNFIFQIFQKDGVFNNTSKNFGQFFYYLTRVLLVFQLDINQTKKNEMLNQDFFGILQICYKIVTGNEPPSLFKNAINTLQSSNSDLIEGLMKEVVEFILKETELKQFLGIKDNNPQISQKFYLLFKLLYNIFHRPTISLSDGIVVQNIIQLLQIAGEDFISKELVQNLVGLIQGDLKSILSLINYLNLINQNDAKAIKDIINNTQKLAVFKNRSSLQEIKATPQQVLDDQMKDILKRIQEGKINVQDIYRTLLNQEGQNGMISIDTFCTFLSRTGIELSQHRANEIFAIIKKANKSINTQQQQLLSEEEFELAFEYVSNKKINMSLEKLGISAALLALSLGTLIVILILLFVFIFLGIQAFTLGGTFGAIINSIIPMGAATGTAVSQEDKSQNLHEKNIKNVVKETEFILHSKQL